MKKEKKKKKRNKRNRGARSCQLGAASSRLPRGRAGTGTGGARCRRAGSPGAPTAGGSRRRGREVGAATSGDLSQAICFECWFLLVFALCQNVLDCRDLVPR